MIKQPRFFVVKRLAIAFLKLKKYLNVRQVKTYYIYR